MSYYQWARLAASRQGRKEGEEGPGATPEKCQQIVMDFVLLRCLHWSLFIHGKLGVHRKVRVLDKTRPKLPWDMERPTVARMVIELVRFIMNTNLLKTVLTSNLAH